MKMIIIILLSLIPSLFWLLVIRFIDRRRPEPRRFIILAFILGIIIAFLALQVGKLVLSLLNSFSVSSLAYILIGSFLIDGLIEELAKFSVVRGLIYSRSFFDEPLDGIVYMVTVALGLAFFENLLIARQIGPEILCLRAVTATLMHVLAGGITGYYLGLAKFRRKKEKRSSTHLIILGLSLAIIFHGLYNTIARANVVWNLLPIAVLLIVVYWFILRGIKRLRYQPIPKD